MLQTLAFLVVAALFVAKLAWNVAVPYVVVRRGATGRVSLMPGVELVLLGGAVGFGEGSWMHLLFGLGAVVASYLHLVVVGWWLGRRRRDEAGG